MYGRRIRDRSGGEGMAEKGMGKKNRTATTTATPMRSWNVRPHNQTHSFGCVRDSNYNSSGHAHAK
eukprot:7271945-Pyramimonas_sp.AAC.1